VYILHYLFGECTRGVIYRLGLYHSRHNGIDRQYECDRGISWNIRANFTFPPRIWLTDNLLSAFIAFLDVTSQHDEFLYLYVFSFLRSGYFEHVTAAIMQICSGCARLCNSIIVKRPEISHTRGYLWGVGRGFDRCTKWLTLAESKKTVDMDRLFNF